MLNVICLEHTIPNGDETGTEESDDDDYDFVPVEGACLRILSQRPDWRVSRSGKHA